MPGVTSVSSAPMVDIIFWRSKLARSLASKSPSIFTLPSPGRLFAGCLSQRSRRGNRADASLEGGDGTHRPDRAFQHAVTMTGLQESPPC